MIADMGITPQRFSEGFTYEAYLNQLGDSRKTFAEHEAAFQLTPADIRLFKNLVDKSGVAKVVAIVEDWCPDVHRGLPIMAAIARASGIEMRVFPRDKNLDIMNLYLNQGKYMSIPVFVFFNQDLNPLGHWIERPKAATRFMEKLAAELSKEKLEEEELRKERRKRSQLMANEWRQQTLEELKELLRNFRPR